MTYGTLRHRLGSTAGFEALVAGNRVALLHDGEQCFPAMLEAIAQARSEILLEMYWFGSDATGRRFADLLSRRARDGLRVCVIYDAVGSLQADDAMFEAMRGAGVHVHQYNPIAPWRRRFDLALVNHRDHRKLLVCDRRVGFTGGVNLGDPWLPERDGGGGFRDDMVRIRGPAVEQMRQVFVTTWSEVHGELPPGPDTVEDATAGPAAGSRVRVLANHYLGERRAIRRAYLARIRAARDRVLITNSYFCPDGVVRRALAKAAKRGVEVRVMVPGVGDVPAVYWASRRLYPWLLRRGIQLHEWQGSVLHAKSAVIDGSWCTVGTYNLDYRSMRFNLEVTAVIEDAALGAAMEAKYREDLRNAPAVDLRSFRYRPLAERLLERLFYLFRKLL